MARVVVLSCPFRGLFALHVRCLDITFTYVRTVDLARSEKETKLRGGGSILLVQRKYSTRLIDRYIDFIQIHRHKDRNSIVL
jgi:hypothetical protein